MKRVDPGRLALLAEFGHEDELLEAVQALREAGAERLEAWVPHEVRGLPEAFGLERPTTARFALVAGLVGAALAWLVQWWTNAVAYPLNVGGRPLHAAPAFVLITFEMAVLFAAVAIFVVALRRSAMPDLTHPLFEVDGFERASVDRYWLGIEARDPTLGGMGSAERMRALGALRVIVLEEAR